MQSLGLITRINVLTAIRDHDLQGATDFRGTLGFDGPYDDVVVERGRRYDARALLAYAHGKATGDYLGPDRVDLSALKVLSDLGFRVTTLTELDRPKPASTARVRTPRAPSAGPSARASARASVPRKAEPAVKLCPTCYTQLSVAGTCDFCDD